MAFDASTVKVFKPVQLTNAVESMLVTELGIATLVNRVLPLNALTPIETTEYGVPSLIIVDGIETELAVVVWFPKSTVAVNGVVDDNV